MPFSSVPEERFLIDIWKTWLDYFSTDPDFRGVSITMKQPDVDKNFKLPALVLKRVAEEDRSLSRLGGYFGDLSSESERLSGFTYQATYQLDLLTKSNGEQNKYASLILGKLKASPGTTLFANGIQPALTEIPIKDFLSPENPEGTATDLKIKFRFWKNVTMADVPTFDAEFHQYSITVQFWVNYINPETVSIIDTISTISGIILN